MNRMFSHRIVMWDYQNQQEECIEFLEITALLKRANPMAHSSDASTLNAICIEVWSLTRANVCYSKRFELIACSSQPALQIYHQIQDKLQ